MNRVGLYWQTWPFHQDGHSRRFSRCRADSTVERFNSSTPLVLCLLNGWCFAARDFRPRRGASDEHIPKWICKERATKPGPKRTAALRVAPRLACGFVARRSQPHFGGCRLLAPRHRPTWRQQNTSHLGDTPLRLTLI